MSYTPPSTPTPIPRSCADRRAWPRRRRLLRVLLLPEGAVVDDPLEAWLVDSSPGGMRLAIPHGSFVDGTILQVKMASAGPATAWTRIRVLNRRRKKTGWEMGCQRVQIPQRNTVPAAR